MVGDDRNVRAMLLKACAAAARLVEQLKAEQVEVQARAPGPSAEHWQQGLQALGQAIDAAERTRAALEALAGIDRNPSN